MSVKPVNYIQNDIDPELRKIMWQYCIDHSCVMPNGYLKILFFIRDENDFWRRVQARKNGFKRYDAEDKYVKQISYRTMFESFLYHERFKKERIQAMELITASGPWQKRIALWMYRKIRDYLFYKKHDT